jgi:exopolysaccharide production protein ExoZ
LSAILILLVITPVIFGWTLSTPWKDWTAPLLLEFIFGMAIGTIFCEGWRLRPAISCALGAAAIATFATVLAVGITDGTIVYGFARPLTWGIGAALIVAAFALADVRHRVPFVLRPAEKLGDASYALYLCHPLVLPLMLAVGVPKLIEPAQHGYTFAILFFGLAIAAAIMLHHVDEAGRKRILAAFRTTKLKRHGPDLSVENGKTRPVNLIPMSP